MAIKESSHVKSSLSMQQQIKLEPINHTQIKFTHLFKNKLKTKIKRLYINKELIEFIEKTISKLSTKDKLAGLYFFRKLAIQTLREPDPDHYQAFKDAYDEELSSIVIEQRHYNPIRWLEAEIQYIFSTTEQITLKEGNQNLDIMQETKLKLSKPWLTKDEVMNLFNFSKSTLNRRIAEGMPAHKNGKFIYFYLEELTKWFKQENN